MRIVESYFNQIKDVQNFRKNKLPQKLLNITVLLSFLSVIIHLGALLLRSCQLLRNKTSATLKIEEIANNQLQITPEKPESQTILEHSHSDNVTSLPSTKQQIVPSQNSDEHTAVLTPNQSAQIASSVPSIQKVQNYPGDLDKPLLGNFVKTSDSELTIDWDKGPVLSIRAQDMFASKAQIIVNAANTDLGGGAGIDGLIHDKGGDSYKKAHQALKKKFRGNYTSGYAALISGGDLVEKHNIQHVIVVAGPSGNSTKEKEDQLYSCYFNSLVLADQQNKQDNKLTAIAFPSISTGIYGFPLDRAAPICLRAAYDFVHKYPETLLKHISIHFLPTEKDKLEFFGKLFKKS